ncbi:WD40-repeat-containing domain protein [Sphaerosporella brunnea]|uniref:Pre-mRNA-processing factor 19 n=1 Tax=Sphaerosporella brunnea TaxID=1250544 RepID=A0A5J5EQK2_9PEZI|nr:WD40-repeat-containing domain protein [Sphaerosporella brunnea]
MSMLCAISGEAPTNPVASAKSGTVFEKRLIEAYIAEHGKDPLTGEELSMADLIELKSSNIVRPRPPTLTSIPALLATFQNEWDALALETYTLRQQLAQVQQELSTALYQHDAATRVIARLLKERDEAREALSHVTVGAGGFATANGEQMDVTQVPSYIQEKIEATKAELGATRKKRSIPEGWVTADTVSSFEVVSTSAPLFRGTKALALDASGRVALIGGANGIAGIYTVSYRKYLRTSKTSDGSPRIYGVSQQQLLQPLNASDGAINDVAWAGKSAVTASSSGVVRVWNEQGTDSISMTAHAGDVVAIAVHPAKSIVASAGADKSWVLCDIEARKSVVQVYDPSKFTAAQFHPDGYLFGLGTDSQIKIFDVRSATIAGSLGPVAAPVSSLSFSENGYWLAVALLGQSIAEIWDLRKQAVTKSLDIGSRVDHVTWDYTGQFLAASGPSGISVQHYAKATKSWSKPLQAAIPSVATAWGSKGNNLMSVNHSGKITIMESP